MKTQIEKEIEKEEQRRECLYKAIGKRNYLSELIRELNKDYIESCKSVNIWSN